MGQNNIDQYFQEALSSHESPIDSNALWNDIQQKRKVNQRYLWLALSSVISTILIAGFFWTNKTQNKTSLQKQNYASVEVASEKAIVSTSAYSDNNLDEKRFTNSAQNNSKLISNNKKTDNSNALQTTLVSEKSATTVGTKSSNLEFENNRVEKQSLNNNSNSKLIDQTVATEIETNTFNIKKIEEGKDYLNEANQSSTTETLEAAIPSSQTIQISGINTIESNSVNSLAQSAPANFPLGKAKTECPSFGTKKSQLYVLGYTSIDYVSSSLNTSLENQAYLAARSNSQSYRPSGRAGIQLKWMHDKGFYIKAGLEYAQVREKFRHRTETTTTEILPNQLINIHIDMNGDTIRTYGNAPVTTIETKNWRVKNSYRSFDIPVFVGYQVEMGDWFYGLEAGVSYNLKFDFNGMLLDPSNTPIEAVDYFRSSNDFSLGAGLVLGKRINANTSVFTNLQWRSNLTEINRGANAVNQKFRSIGLGVGLEYKI